MLQYTLGEAVGNHGLTAYTDRWPPPQTPSESHRVLQVQKLHRECQDIGMVAGDANIGLNAI